MRLFDIEDRFVLGLLAKTAKTDEDTFLKRGWYICDQTGLIHAHRDGFWKIGVDSSENGFWKTRDEALDFIARMKKEIL